MTNNKLTPEEIARIAKALRTSNFNPTKGRGKGRKPGKYNQR